VPYQARPVRAGVLVVQNWYFNTGSHQNETHTLVLVATTTNELFCFSEGDLLQNGSAGKPLWFTSLASSNLPPRTRPGSNLATPIGICGTPVVDAPNGRMFVVAMWESGPGQGSGNYSIFSISLDTGYITKSEQLVDSGANGRITFNADVVDQRTAINYVGGWLWLGFAAYLAYDAGDYSGWVVAINPNNLAQQLYQPMISLGSFNNSAWKLRGAGIWGVGGLAAANDSTVYTLTGNGGLDLNPPPPSYWISNPDGPGKAEDFFQAAVRLGVEASGSGSQLVVLDWFQDSTLTQNENAGDWDFGGSSAVVLPPINGRQLLAFIPKDGNIFILNTQNLGKYSPAFVIEKFADADAKGGNDTKTALAFLQTPSGQNILIAGADSNGAFGGLAAFQINASANPPTLTELWTSPHVLYDSFGAPTVIANPVADPKNPPNLVGLAWVIDGSQGFGGSFFGNCAMRAYDVLTGSIAYNSDVTHEVTEQIPNFAAITSGSNSVFCPTMTGFMGFTQFTGWSGTHGWEAIGGFFPAGCPVTAVSRKPGQLDLFLVGIDGYVYTSWWSDGNVWSGYNGWRRIGGIFPPGSRIAAVARTPDNLDIFVCGNDGRVYTSWWSSQKDWSGVNNPWRSLGGFFPKGNQVTAVSRTPNNLDLFIVGGDGVVYTSWWSNTADWSGINNDWRNLGGTFPPTTRVAAVARTQNNLDLFICGNDGFVYTSWWTNKSDWSGIGNKWRNIGGIFPVGAMVTAVARKADQLDLFITGINGDIYTSWWFPAGDWSGLNGWESLGGIFNSHTEVAAVHRSPGSLDLFVCGDNGLVYTTWWSEGNNWSSITNQGWLNIGGTFPANVHVDAVSRTTGNMDLFICGIDGRVYTSWWNVSGR
jgi:hypothetical protein